MKKRIHLFILMIYLIVALCGCKSLNSQPVSLEDSISIPKDGKISAAVFNKLKEENKVVTFYGKSKGIRYEWTVFGSDVKEVKELNLGIEITQADRDKIVFRYSSKENFGFSPVLSIYLNDLWEAQHAEVYEVSKSGTAKIGQAEITAKEHSILNFTTKVQKGTFEIIPEQKIEAASGQAATMEALSLDVSGEAKPATAQAAEGSQNSSSDASSVSDSQSKQVETGNASKTGDSDSNTSRKSLGGESNPGSVNAKGEITGSQSNSSPNGMNSNVVPSASSSGQTNVGQDGANSSQDKYKTDPIPEEPDTQEVDKRKRYTCTFSMECSSILNHLDELEADKLDVLPKNGVVFAPQTVIFYEGESVYDVLQRVCQEKGIQLEASWTPMYNSAYVEGIHNLYEFDCGSGSGWMYRVNGWYPNYGCSRYLLKPGEVVEWRYTCDLGKDIGGGNAMGN